MAYSKHLVSTVITTKRTIELSKEEVIQAVKDFALKLGYEYDSSKDTVEITFDVGCADNVRSATIVFQTTEYTEEKL